jgi:glycosyltransferase involved in cell wall biosynthesis
VATEVATAPLGQSVNPSSPPPASLLIVTTIPETIDGFLVPYVEHFRREGWNVGLAAGHGVLSERTRAAANTVHLVPWTRNPKQLVKVVRSARLFRKIVADGGYDIVHVHTPVAASVARGSLAVSRRSHRPAIVYTAHGFHFTPDQPWFRRLPSQVVEWLAGRVTDRLVVINEADYLSAKRLRLVSPGHLVHMPGIGLDLGWYDRTPELLERAAGVRTELGLGADQPLFTMIAEMIPRKAHAEALDALAAMTHTHAHLALAGDGPLLATIEQQIRDRGLSSRVHLLSRVADVRALIVASQATVLPSYREGLSRAVMESLALGVPVVGADIRGIADAVRPDGGVLVAPGDVAALAAALDTVASEPTLDAEARQAIRARLASYSIDSLIASHEALYDDVRDEFARRRPSR